MPPRRNYIRCRARLSSRCMDGQSGRAPMMYDNSFDGASIVCDPCGLELGPVPDGADWHVIDRAIKRVKRWRAGWR